MSACLFVPLSHPPPCRVVLQQPDPPYLNASTVTYTTPSLRLAPCSYIATQGPLPATTADFWAMVLQQQVPAVVMLTSCAEAGVVKCGQYFPHALGAVSREGCATVKVRGELCEGCVRGGEEL